MAPYKILYIDEEKIWRDNFTRYTYDAFEVETIAPFEDQDELLHYIRYSSAEAVILDHLLSEKMPEINYDGVDIVKKLKQYNERFPLFVLTSHDVKAMEQAEDVNYVYPKNVISQKEKQVDGKGEFNERIRLQIEHYQKACEASENEFMALIQKADTGPLNALEEERLIELDTFLSQQVGHDLDIPEHLKKTSNAELTQKLINISEELISKITAQKIDNA
ncbi:DNA-binding transcriptional response regulator [Kordiimonas pumila]|uniref:Response regulatory domain-containing protein n=1 Tax=Kordiimonas pumila TaxID=2161677 RepID=A0ABV7D4Q4_9PROT|nr:hypothetical protein [Kordiimonas pumila]